METVSIIGIDFAKNVFHLRGATVDGAVVFRKKLTRGKFLDFVEK
jgi:transposase